MLISLTVNHTGVDAAGCAKANLRCPDPHSSNNRWISQAHLETQAASTLGPLSPPRIDYSSWLILGQLIPATSVLSVPYLLLSLTNLTFMVHWLASVRAAACKFTLKSFVLTAFSQAPGRGRTGSRQARPPALITVSKSGFEPLGWSLGPTQRGLTWQKVNLCHTCATIWIMEFCNLSERGGKRSPGGKKMPVPGFTDFYAKYLHQSLCFLCKYTRNVWTHEILEHIWFWNRKKAKERQAPILYTAAFRTSAHHQCLTAIPGEKRTSLLLQELNKVQVFPLDRTCLTHKTTLQLPVTLRWNSFPTNNKNCCNLHGGISRHPPSVSGDYRFHQTTCWPDAWWGRDCVFSAASKSPTLLPPFCY